MSEGPRGRRVPEEGARVNDRRSSRGQGARAASRGFGQLKGACVGAATARAPGGRGWACSTNRMVLEPSSEVWQGPLPSAPLSTLTVKSSLPTVKEHSWRPPRSVPSTTAEASLVWASHPSPVSYIHTTRSSGTSKSSSAAPGATPPASTN